MEIGANVNDSSGFDGDMQKNVRDGLDIYAL